MCFKMPVQQEDELPLEESPPFSPEKIAKRYEMTLMILSTKCG